MALLILTLTGGMVARAIATASNPTTEHMNQENVFAGYVAPTGPELELSKVQGIALTRASWAQDTEPTDTQAAQGTFEQVRHVMDPQLVTSAPTSAGEEAYLHSQALLVVMHGQFTLDDAPVPKGQPSPTGSVMELIVNAHTGFVEGVYLGEHEPSALSSLGSVIDLQNPMAQSATVHRSATVRPTTISVHVYVAGGPERVARRGPHPARGLMVNVGRANGTMISTRTNRHGVVSFRVRSGHYLVTASFQLGQKCASARTVVQTGQTRNIQLYCSIP
jgi:hypothetical protein